MHSFLRSLFLLTGVLTLIVACGGDSGGTPDTTAPTVSPGEQVNAARNMVTAVFSEPMNNATVNTSTFKLEDSGGAAVAGKVSYSGIVGVFTPDVQLDSSKTYTATITTGAQDTTGNGVANDVIWSLTTASGNIQISWDANREAAVNRGGGGYVVYYSTSSGFSPGDGGVTVIDVPYSSGLSTPTSILIPFNPGTYYLQIAAYSALNAPGSSSGSTSTTTPQITLIAP